MRFPVILSYVASALGSSGALAQLRKFPEDFVFGAASSAYQIEGGWNEDGKGENIWDVMIHNKPHGIKDQSNGDVAADSYHNYKRDVEMMRELGLDAYRFSLSWSRLLPSGFTNQMNPAGVQFYNNYIDEMLKYNITPFVTLYHWDLPQKLQDLGGFANPLLSELFEDYARVAFELFGDRVKYWITFNEPKVTCNRILGYGWNTTGIGEYLCAKHLLIAHARAYHAYNNDFKLSQGGQCGITFSTPWYEGLTDSEEDEAAVELARQGQLSMYSDPIFSEKGGFPKELSERVASKSKAQGYPRSRLLEFTEEEKAYVKGTADFMGLNHYTAVLVSAKDYKSVHPVPSLDDDIDAGTYVPEEWPKSASSWLVLGPNSLYKVLTHLHKQYNGVTIYVTENGWSTTPGAGLVDDDRVTYYRAALNDVLDALDAGVNLKGYMAWSLMDSFEWTSGYTERYGLYEVDFSAPERTRTARKSALVYKHVVAHRHVDPVYSPSSLDIADDDGNIQEKKKSIYSC